MANLCCVLGSKLMCFDCQEFLCTHCSWIGNLKQRPSRPKGIYVLCQECLDTVPKDLKSSIFYRASGMENKL